MPVRSLAAATSAVLAALVLTACSGASAPATNVTDTTATLNAHGSCLQACEGWIRYRKAGAGGWTDTTHFTTPAVKDTAFSRTVTGLASGTAYEYQACGRETSWAAGAFACLGPDGSTTGTSTFTTQRSAVVSLGDSYISGEAGRWQGNSDTVAGSRDGTDRACAPSASTCTSYDKSKVYLDGSDTNGCHRSDTAEIRSATVAADDHVNLACSGAVSANVFRASNGGQTQDGLPPQADQLATLAAKERVKLIVLSIGGNDLGFASIVQACLTAYETHSTPCETTQGPGLTAKFPAMEASVGKAIDEIRAVMSAAGQGQSTYRLVLQSYPSVIPRASENRYAELDPSRTGLGGCPFYDSDSNWARDTVVPAISSHLRAVAANRGTEFLDLQNALQGHEICAKSDALVTPLVPPSASTSEWGRLVNQSTIAEGDLQEAFHPNAYAQQALGRCLTLERAQPAGAYACTGHAGQGPAAMTLAASP